MSSDSYDIGVIGLGPIGSNLTLRLADLGFPVTGLDSDPAAVARCRTMDPDGRVALVENLSALLCGRERPRLVIVLVPAGAPVESVLAELRPALGPDDIVIEAGNSHYADTDRRAAAFQEAGVGFLGMGISGGHRGARLGPALMVGGRTEDYNKIADVLARTAATGPDGRSCVGYFGAGGAGHLVKMVHNGIEYAVMQAMAEVGMVLLRSGMPHSQIANEMQAWNEGPIQSYLLETAVRVMRAVDPNGRALVDQIADRSGHKGTGLWTVQTGLELGVPISTILAALEARVQSAMPRFANATASSSELEPAEQERLVAAARDALEVAMVIAFAQGFMLLTAAFAERGLDPVQAADAAMVWQAGCIIRASMLQEIEVDLRERPHESLLSSDERRARLHSLRPGLADFLGGAQQLRCPTPTVAAAAGTHDSLLDGGQLPGAIVQAQRDCFGAHGLEQRDLSGRYFHEWVEEP